jgi:hypothetical protein
MYDSHNSAFDVAGGDSSQYAGDPGDNELLQDATYLLLREQLAHLKKVVADLPNPEAILDQEEGRLANDDNAIATDATASSATAASPRTVRFDPNVTVFHPPPEDYSSSEDEGAGEHPMRNAQDPSEKQKGQTNDFFKSAMNSRRNIVRKPRKRATKETKEQKKEQKNKAKRGTANELRGTTTRGTKGRWKATLSNAVRRKGRSSSPPTPTSTKRTLQRRSNSTRPQHWNRLDGESDDADNGDSAHCRSDENDNTHRDGPIIRITVDQADTDAPDASQNRSRSSHGRQQQQEHSASNMRAGEDSRDDATSESETDEENTKAEMGFESVQATTDTAQESEHTTRQTRAGFGVARADSIKLRRRHKQKHAQRRSETATTSGADTAPPTPKSSSDRAHHKRRHFSVGSIRRVRSESTSSHQTRKLWTRSAISQRTHNIRLNLKRPRLRGGGGEWNSYSYSSREAIRRLASERADEERDTDAGMDRGGNYDDASSPEIRNSERSRRTHGGFESASAERAPPATFSMTESYSLDRGAGVLERREGGPPGARSAAERSSSSICSSCAVQ